MANEPVNVKIDVSNTLPHAMLAPFRPHRTSISDVPNEVLVLIFHEIFDSTGTRSIRKGWQFPESVASVCSQWRAVMFSVSIFWTVMLITVDDNPTPQSVIRRYLALSKERPLDITICRHEMWFDSHDLIRARIFEDPEYRARLADPVEKWRMAAVMDLLTPHQDRWERLYIYVMHSTSLPQPYLDLSGAFPSLKYLFIHCVLDEGPDERFAPTTGIMDVPILELMETNGLFLRQMSDTTFPNLDELAIEEYPRYYPPWRTTDLVRCIRKMPALLILRLDNVNLRILDDELPDDDYALKLELMDFRHMSGDVLENLNALLDWPVLDVVVYNDCSIPRPAELFRASRYGAIKCMQTEQDVLNVLRDWDDENCTRLHITNSVFTENIIHALSEPQPDGSWMCPYLYSLSISGFCRGFSDCEPAQVAFIRMIKIRHALEASTGYVSSFAASSLYGVRVNIQGNVQKVSTEALEWLDANVHSVTWGDWSGGIRLRAENEGEE
ncbi:hypothetical protein POSPLADRAFT_1157250 [Postia placenta MAD-698-R-SB12]|uniref:F-box domain-containing protein n=1 Tax=Postia placenta MAD-698-R-SB12 TaxID=670580 RepID=A0A1X6ML86_9APHY|nr:hypothetical protein POSPLADRAFT_1157250 [Postia placenta MAD-698-R-SB12]OSX57164.1 hypothetical protein POSPLADRAFT_1157250 [Postia placenta MAD-698-R-SB12]